MGYNIVVSSGKEIAVLNVPIPDPTIDSILYQTLNTFKFH